MTLYRKEINIDTGDLTGAWYSMEFDVGGNIETVVFIPVEADNERCGAEAPEGLLEGGQVGNCYRKRNHEGGHEGTHYCCEGYWEDTT